MADVTRERLDFYVEGLKEYEHLLNQKKKIEDKMSSLKAVDYARDKVTNGNSRKISEPERYAMALQAINARINEIKPWLDNEENDIKAHLAKIKKWHYRRLLVMRYVQRLKWSEITSYFFEFEDDFEDRKNDKYREKMLDWHKCAIEELEKTNAEMQGV